MINISVTCGSCGESHELGATGPAGPPGERGPEGPQGPPGIDSGSNIDTAAPYTTFTYIHNGKSYPPRGTDRTDIIVRWRGPAKPADFIEGVDEFIETAPPAPAYDINVGDNLEAFIVAAPDSAKITIGPGTYRISNKLDLKANQQLVGPEGGYADIVGDVVLNGWIKDGSASRWYTTSGNLPNPYSDTGQCEIDTGTNANSCKQREQVWIGGTHLTRVMTVDQVAAGTFYQDFVTKRTYIGQNPDVLAAEGKAVEMSKVDHAINSNAAGVKLKNLMFRRFASPGQSAAVVLSGTDVEVSYCKFTENHAIGFHITQAHRAWIHHNEMVKNGQLGMGHHKSHSTIIEHNIFNENNTDGFWRADWESGGFKATYSEGTIFRGNTAYNNEGVGIWFDIDNIRIEIFDNVSTDNYADGIRYEISQSAKIYDNRVENNGFRYANSGGKGSDYSMFAVAGINVNSSPDVEVYGNEVLNNQNGISLQSRNRGSSTNPTYGVREIRNAHVHHNHVRQAIGDEWGEGVAAGLNTLGQSSPSRFYTTMNNRFENNTYEVSSLSGRQFSWNQSYMTFANFKAAGQDVQSTATVIA